MARVSHLSAAKLGLADIVGGMSATAHHARHSVIVQPHSCLLPVACSALDKVQPRAVSYEEQVAAIREQLAALYESQVGALCGVMLRCVSSCTGVACTVGCPALSQERRMLPMCCLLYIHPHSAPTLAGLAQEEWSKAAHALAGIDLDSGMRLLDAGGQQGVGNVVLKGHALVWSGMRLLEAGGRQRAGGVAAQYSAWSQVAWASFLASCCCCRVRLALAQLTSGQGHGDCAAQLGHKPPAPSSAHGLSTNICRVQAGQEHQNCDAVPGGRGCGQR